jgi:hypothetical protein
MLTDAWAAPLALAVLLLWPGLLIVRAPWPFVPFLSLSFWLVSWGWLAPSGPGRHRFLIVTLALSLLLSGMRLLKPLEASRPSWPTMAVLAAALARLAPFFWWLAAPGLAPAFSSSSAQLLVWRDGLPASYLPLYPILGFGLGDSGLATLAADVSLLSGVAPYRALLLATLASEGLLIVALFAFARRFWSAAWSSLAVAAGAALGLLVAARADIPGGTALALAFAVGGASLVLHACGRSPCVAAGALWAGGAAVSGPLAVVGAVATAATIVAKPDRRPGRFALAVVVAALLAAAVLGRTSTGHLNAPGWIPSALLLFVVFGIPATGGRKPSRQPTPWLNATCTVLALAATLADWRVRSARVLVSPDDIAAAARLREHSEATDVVCADDPASGAWIPALAGRASSPPRWPEAGGAPRFGPPLAPCRYLWASPRPSHLPAYGR